MKNKLHTECAKCSEKLEPNNQGALDITYDGGYGDFVDNYDGELLFLRLCHKHAHQFAYWVNNESAITKWHGHAHNGSEKGFWYGHIGWDQYTWLSHLNMFLMHLVQDGFRFARLNFVRNIKDRINWCREDINDSSTKILWGSFFIKLFFLKTRYKGFFYSLYLKIVRARHQRVKKIYRKHYSLHSELFDGVKNSSIPQDTLDLIKRMGLALKEMEEE